MWKALVLDKDGTLVNCKQPIPGASLLIDTIVTKGIPFVILSNTGEKDAAAVARALSLTLEVTIHERHVFTAMQHMRSTLVSSNFSNIFVIGPVDMENTQRFDEVKFEANVDYSNTCIAVFTDGNLDDYVNILTKVTLFLKAGATMFCSSEDISISIEQENGTVAQRPGPGIFVNAVRQMAPESTVRTFGKGSDPQIGSKAMEILKAQGFTGKDRDVLVVGDRFDTDVRTGNLNGWSTCLVESGCHAVSQRALFPSDTADIVASSVQDLIQMKVENNNTSSVIPELIRETVRIALRYMPTSASYKLAEKWQERLKTAVLALPPPRRVKSCGDLSTM